MNYLVIFLSIIITNFNCIENVNGFRVRNRLAKCTCKLFANKIDNIDPDLEKISNLKGFYVRPSRAIEKGGGFFVPGLEGGKIRIFSAVILLSFTAWNRSSGTETVNAIVSEVIGVIASLLLLFQGLAESIPAVSGNEVVSSSEDYLVISKAESQINSHSATTIEEICKTVAQTVVNLNYILVLKAGSKIYEAAPKSYGISKENKNEGWAQVGYSGSTLQVFPRSEVSSQSLPTATDAVGVIEDKRDLMWIIGTATTENSEATTELTSKKEWIESILAAPFPNT